MPNTNEPGWHISLYSWVGRFDMAIHDGAGGFDAERMGRLHHLEPLPCVDLVGADDGADFVVENFGGGAGQAAEAGAF